MYLTPESRDALAAQGMVRLARSGAGVRVTPVPPGREVDEVAVATCGRAMLIFPASLWDHVRGRVAELDGAGRLSLRDQRDGEADRLCLVRVSTGAQR